MNIITITLYMTALLWAYLGLKTLLSARRNDTYIIFSLICLAMVIWGVISGISFSLELFEHMQLIAEIGYLVIFFYFPLNLHFAFAISKFRIKKWMVVLCYVPAIILDISSLFGFTIYSGFFRIGNLLAVILNTGSPLLYLYICYMIFCFFMSFYVILRWRIQTKINKEKMYSGIILAMLTPAYVGGFILTICLPLKGIYIYQGPGVALFNFYAIALYFIIKRYRFMNLDYTFMGDEIISSINDMVIVLDRDLNIVEANKRFRRMFPGTGSYLQNKNFYDLVEETGHVEEVITKMSEGGITSTVLRLTYKSCGEYTVTKTHLAKMKDKFGDDAGYFVISDEVRGIKQFRKNYRITRRELEVIELIISGLTYREISERLNIAEKTVEAHLTNIYNKIGINNKIELIRIAGDFNIVPSAVKQPSGTIQ